MSKPLFPLGQIVATAAVSELIHQHGLDAEIQNLLQRHVTGDYGNVCDSDKAENELSVKEGYRILSAYSICIGTEEYKIWIITEADRSVTTLLFPSEY